MARMPGVPFVVPRSFSRGRPDGPPRFVVMHYTAGSEGPTAAEDGVAWDQRRTDGTSSHFYCDRDSIIQCVDTLDRSHTALYHGNLWGIHIEQCGTVQTTEQWLDAASRPTIRNAARIAAWALKTHALPLDRLIVREVRTGRGVCGHYDCTYGFPEDGGTHTDPGTQYPYTVLFDDIRAYLSGVEPEEEDDMFPTAIKTPSADQVKASPPVAARTYSESEFDDLIGYDLARGDVTMRTVLALSGQLVTLTAQMGALIGAANAEVQRDAEERERELAAEAAEAERDAVELAELRALRAELAALDPGDTDALRDLLARIRVTVAE